MVRQMAESNCEWCGKKIVRRGNKKGRFCSLSCKAEWQRTQKPVTRDWLYQRYVVEGLSTYQIAKMVNRDPKRVWEWLRDFGIPTRERTWDNQPSPDKPYQQREWLIQAYLVEKRSAADIGKQFGVTEATILHFLEKHRIERRTGPETRKLNGKYVGFKGKLNGMYGKRGSLHPNWKGGFTPERQAFYSSIEWRKVARAVWRRDRGTCQRCGRRPRTREERRDFHIHHIVSFAYKPLRARLDNLVLLCRDCHRWVHSKENVDGMFRKHITVQRRLF